MSTKGLQSIGDIHQNIVEGVGTGIRRVTGATARISSLGGTIKPIDRLIRQAGGQFGSLHTRVNKSISSATGLEGTPRQPEAVGVAAGEPGRIAQDINLLAAGRGRTPFREAQRRGASGGTIVSGANIEQQLAQLTDLFQQRSSSLRAQQVSPGLGGRSLLGRSGSFLT